MTYILGFKQPGINAIITDCRRTMLIDGTGENDIAKTGFLCPGCIYGRIGSAEKSQQFINAFQQSIDGTINTPEGFSQRLEQFVTSYSFPQGKGNHFKLLLSKRMFGVPLFSILDSNTGLSPILESAQNYLITYALGKNALDPIVNETFVPRLKSHLSDLVSNNYVQDINTARTLAPYFLCLWLSELSLTFEKSWLEAAKNGVGAPFHFMFQTYNGEVPQKPAIYIFSSRDGTKKDIYSWIYRVAYLSRGVYFETRMPPMQDQRYPSGKIERAMIGPDPELIEIESNILSESEIELNALPYFYFCGIGFSPPSNRNTNGYFVSPTGNIAEIFGETGKFQPAIEHLIKANFGL